MFEWIKKMWYTHTMISIHPLKKNVLYAAIWLNIESIMPNEMSVTKDKYYDILLI